MKRKTVQNPYCDFKGDRERRRALNTLAWSRAMPAMLAGTPTCIAASSC
jgi:hypothetical protein